MTWNSLDDGEYVGNVQNAMRPLGDKGSDPTKIYRLAQGALAIHILHPSARASYRHEQWSALVRAFLDQLANELAPKGTA